MILATVSGVIDQIFIFQGALVCAGDMLADLKIDGHPHVLLSPVTGSIKRIAVQENDSVAANDLLFEIEA